ncbi:peptidoglycan DD-metalloendopeptidase family protein [Rossellomorea sp. NPDC077527]|uniref:peptidoglycan DD-metalloendopeptidase family protein n=1 Tax=Rossellomorea sp. NPDC077527 TaxID=3364510 RepID=UPI0037C729B2
MKSRYFKLVLVAMLFGGTGFFSTGKASATTPTFQMPFPCGQVWEGQTRTNHSPLNAVDFNRSNDQGDTVVASSSGTVVKVKDLGSSSYGKYIVIDHGGGWTTLYAHLNSFSISSGQKVSQGQKIGTVGATGNVTGAHLHFEQLYNGSPQKIKFNGSQITYYGSKNYTSKNSCTSEGVKGTVHTDSGAPLNIRSGPGTNYNVVGSVSDGATVTISCQKRGETVTGKYGTSNLWNYIGDGYISDTYVYTGSDGQVAPTCSE